MCGDAFDHDRVDRDVLKSVAIPGFDFGDASAQPVLTGKTLDQTATDYSQMLKADLKNTDYSVALAGMGADGHIMGIKPKSPSTNSGHLAAGYKWDDFVRLTATPKFVEQLDEVVVYAMGLEKWPQFDDLEKGIKLDDQPAQVLKQVKKVTIFNDYKGEQQ